MRSYGRVHPSIVKTGFCPVKGEAWCGVSGGAYRGGAMLSTTASIKTPTCTVEVLQADWPRPVELTWHDSHAVLTLLFRDADYEIEGRYPDAGAARRLDRVGRVFFVPPD